jgi:GTP-binding protein
MKRHRAEFVTSASSPAGFPRPELPEFAFAGRSNVGKSSLLNALAGRKALANVSKTPGRTQLLNCFTLTNHDDRAVIDCPGYGYAAVSKDKRASWGRMIDRYLLERESLAMVLVLVDGEIGPTKLDQQLLEWLRSNTIPHSVIATKHDKVKSSVRERRKRDLAAGCDLEPGDVVWVSAAKNVGIDRLRDLVRLWLEV